MSNDKNTNVSMFDIQILKVMFDIWTAGGTLSTGNSSNVFLEQLFQSGLVRLVAGDQGKKLDMRLTDVGKRYLESVMEVMKYYK